MQKSPANHQLHHRASQIHFNRSLPFKQNGTHAYRRRLVATAAAEMWKWDDIFDSECIFSCTSDLYLFMLFPKKVGKRTHMCFSILWAFVNTFRLKLNPDPSGWSHRPLWYSSHVFFRGAQVHSEVHSRARSDCLFCFVQFPRSARGHSLCCSYLGPLIAVIKQWECRQVAWGCNFPLLWPMLGKNWLSLCLHGHTADDVRGQRPSNAKANLAGTVQFSSRAETMNVHGA